MITILQHGEHEPSGTIGECLNARHEPFQTLRLDKGDSLPKDPPDRLIILGGQMSVNDESIYPFLAREKTLVRKAIARDATVLGICLGAQMIAAASGKKVCTGEVEQGWRTIQGCNTSGHRFFPDRFEVFHWHKETFDLPDGARLIATGTAVKNQAFLLRHALGVQFHPEVTEPMIAFWAKDLNDTKRLAMLEDTIKKTEGNRILCDAIIHAFLADWKV
ncbi:MAG: type 1 glutamine amidotransferase [Methanoregula sp.]